MPISLPPNDEPVTLDEYNATAAAAMTEAQLQAKVIRVAERCGWKVYHTYISKGSAAGYPDLHLVHPGSGRSIFRELKNATRQPTAKHREWLAALVACGNDASIWRPADWFNGTIAAVLDPPPIGGTS